MHPAEIVRFELNGLNDLADVHLGAHILANYFLLVRIFYALGSGDDDPLCCLFIFKQPLLMVVKDQLRTAISLFENTHCPQPFILIGEMIKHLESHVYSEPISKLGIETNLHILGHSEIDAVVLKVGFAAAVAEVDAVDVTLDLG